MRKTWRCVVLWCFVVCAELCCAVKRCVALRRVCVVWWLCGLVYITAEMRWGVQCYAMGMTPEDRREREEVF